MTLDWSRVRLSLRPKNDKEMAIAKKFATLWAPTLAIAARLGWERVTPGSRVQVYCEENSQSLAEQIFISPSDPERFLVRVTPRSWSDAKPILEALQRAVRSLPAEARQTRVRRGGLVDVVEVRSTWADVVGDDSPSSEVAATRLAAFIAPLLEAVPRRAD